MAALDDRLEAVVRAGFPGAVAVASGPGFHEEGAAGLADVETGERLTPKHRFRIASVTKIFVATVVLQLVDEGALDLDGDAAPIAEGVTIRQLLNHTSGLQDFFDDIVEFFEPYRQDPAYRWPLTHREVLALIKERPLLFPPGTGWSYTGSNYLPLGLLVEETTGTSLAEELRRRITEPLGLDATLLHAGVPAPEGTARGYLPPDNPLVPGPGLVDATDLDMSFSWAGGGMVSTAADVARFLRALLGGEVLPDRLRAEMLRTVPSTGPNRRVRARDRRDLVVAAEGGLALRLRVGPSRVLRERVHDDCARECERRPPGRDHDEQPSEVRRGLGDARPRRLAQLLRLGLRSSRRWTRGTSRSASTSPATSSSFGRGRR